MNHTFSVLVILLAIGLGMCAAAQTGVEPVKIGSYKQETRMFYTAAQGLPADDVHAVEAAAGGLVYAATSRGLAVLHGDRWDPKEGFTDGPVTLLAATEKGELLLVYNSALCDITGRRLASLPEMGSDPGQVRCLAAAAGSVYLGTAQGLYRMAGQRFVPVSELNELLGADKSVRAMAWAPGRGLAVAAASGLFIGKQGGAWQALYPRDTKRSWAPTDVRGVAFDATGRLWFASPQGVGCSKAEELGDAGWALYTGYNGLPYDDFTSVATSPDGSVWFGTTMGAIHYDGKHWAYRQGKRWLPDDVVRDIAVADADHVWFATAKGVGIIERRAMTLAEKAKFYEDEIDKYHRRTPFGYVLEVRVSKPGDKSEWVQSDSDNDGLWTSMYGAGECFAYAATKDPKAKERAKAAFEALRFLGTVTQGGSHPAPHGFVARTILPTSGPDPNIGRVEQDRRTQAERDKYWKVIDPRWPKSADGQWYWKSDTSSDELDGHYFFYGLYYDLVAETEEEKAAVREHTLALTDHLVEHDFCLVDHDGKPTRWAVFSPKALNFDPWWHVERGLNSLSMLSYLAVAEHMSGSGKYRAAADRLINEHSYAQNLLVPKIQTGPGSGNQSDDEMAVMCYYNLIRYEKDPARRRLYQFSAYRYWQLEEPEMNPFFNFAFAVCCLGQTYENPFATFRLSPQDQGWLEDSVDTLKRFPLDRFNWRHTNNRRIDIVPLGMHTYELDETRPARKGARMNGKVIPVDECFFNHWNYDPWSLNTGGDGEGLADGAVFLLPYYMGLYHKFIAD